MMMQPPAPMEGLAYYTQSLLALWPEKAVIGSCVAGVVSPPNMENTRRV